jgi:hypothetical protein
MHMRSKNVPLAALIATITVCVCQKCSCNGRDLNQVIRIGVTIKWFASSGMHAYDTVGLVGHWDCDVASKLIFFRRLPLGNPMTSMAMLAADTIKLTPSTKYPGD